jgi:hypothetical protein
MSSAYNSELSLSLTDIATPVPNLLSLD